MAEVNPLQRLLSAWQSDKAYSDHVRSIWPDLGKELDALVEWSSHVITSPSSVRVPTVAPAAPRSGAGRPSVAPSGESVTGPTSGTVRPVQMPLDLDLEEEK